MADKKYTNLSGPNLLWECFTNWAETLEKVGSYEIARAQHFIEPMHRDVNDGE